MLLLQLAILSKHRSKLLLTTLQLFYYLLCHMDVSFKIYVSVWLYIWVEKRPYWQGEIWSLNCRFENGLVWWWSFYAGIKCLGVPGLCINLTGFEAFSFSQMLLVLGYLIAFCRTLNNMFMWISESVLAFFILLLDTKKKINRNALHVFKSSLPGQKSSQILHFQNIWNNASNISPNEVYQSRWISSSLKYCSCSLLLSHL